VRRPFIVAELSCNHGGSLDEAMQLVKDCAEAGADAIKLQTWTPGTMVLDSSLVIESGPWAGRNMVELYEQAYTPWEWHEPLFARARSLGMVGFSSVFDAGALAFLESIHCPMYKIASFEIVDHYLLRLVAATGKPIILSTGMATMEEVNAAVYHASERGNEITVLVCCSSYPALPENYDLRLGIKHLISERYRVGLSDHTRGIGVAVAFATAGVEVIEKHVAILGDTLDAGFSISPHTLGLMVQACRDAVACYPNADEKPLREFGPLPEEAPQLALRRSLHFACDMVAGQEITHSCLTTARPAHGLPCSDRDSVVGRKVTIAVQAGQPVTTKALI
jgi:sialic acid synthase SpsE